MDNSGVVKGVTTVLLAYSEWLDQEGLVVPEQATDDGRSHEELVNDFLRGSNGAEST